MFLKQGNGKKSLILWTGVPTAKPIIISAQPGSPKPKYLEETVWDLRDGKE
jgi:hypothetical protein